MNQQGGNLESYLTWNCEWHVVWRLSATESQGMSACASMNRKVNSEKNGEWETAAEVNRTAERRKGKVLRKIHRRGSLDRTRVQPDIVEHAGLETQGVLESKIHHRGSQDTSDGPE